MIELLADQAALDRIGAANITALTKSATDATFYVDGLTAEQVAANRRIVAISAETCLAAAANAHQRFVAAFSRGTFAGFVVATAHATDDLELDWLMAHSDFHGTEVAAVLMQAGIDWLGASRPLWLNVLRHNRRAIAFYRKFGFEIDPEARTEHLIPHVVMRRKGSA